MEGREGKRVRGKEGERQEGKRKACATQRCVCVCVCARARALALACVRCAAAYAGLGTCNQFECNVVLSPGAAVSHDGGTHVRRRYWQHCQNHPILHLDSQSVGRNELLARVGE
jgi:hypothetical protein